MEVDLAEEPHVVDEAGAPHSPRPVHRLRSAVAMMVSLAASG
jgi:hypothetical protein